MLWIPLEEAPFSCLFFSPPWLQTNAKTWPKLVCYVITALALITSFIFAVITCIRPFTRARDVDKVGETLNHLHQKLCISVNRTACRLADGELDDAGNVAG